MNRLILPLMLSLPIWQLTACSTNSSPSPPATTPSSAGSSSTDPSSGSSSTAAGATSPAGSAIGDLFNANAATPATIRSAQDTQLKSERNALENNLSIYQQVNCIGLTTGIINDELVVVPRGTTPTLVGGLFTAVGDVGVGAALAGGATTGGASQAYQQGAGALGKGVDAAVNGAQIASDVNTQVSIQNNELQQCNAEVLDLQNQITQKTNQINAIEAQGTQ